MLERPLSDFFYYSSCVQPFNRFSTNLIYLRPVIFIKTISNTQRIRLLYVEKINFFLHTWALDSWTSSIKHNPRDDIHLFFLSQSEGEKVICTKTYNNVQKAREKDNSPEIKTVANESFELRKYNNNWETETLQDIAVITNYAMNVSLYRVNIHCVWGRHNFIKL